MPRVQSLQGRISGATGSYLGNTRTRRIERGVGNRFATHNQNYRILRRAFGLSSG